MHRALRSPRLRSLAVYLALIAIVFGAALAAGFVFAHEPQRETVGVVVRSSPSERPRAYTVAGVIAEVRPGVLVIRGEEQAVEVTVPADVVLEDLARVPGEGEPFAPGTRVNLGTADTQSGFIMTGIVAMDEAAQ